MDKLLGRLWVDSVEKFQALQLVATFKLYLDTSPQASNQMDCLGQSSLHQIRLEAFTFEFFNTTGQIRSFRDVFWIVH
jgi:hypothetical protein